MGKGENIGSQGLSGQELPGKKEFGQKEQQKSSSTQQQSSKDKPIVQWLKSLKIITLITLWMLC